MAAIKHYHPLWSSLAMLIHGPPLYPELKPIITVRTSLLISFIFVLVLLWYIYLCCDKSNILVWDLLIPQPWVLIITNTRKVSISSPFNKYLSNNYWSATEVMIDKVGVIVCMRWKPNPSMCGYDIRELRHMWPAWEHHHPLSAPVSTTQQLYHPWYLSASCSNGRKCRCPGSAVQTCILFIKVVLARYIQLLWHSRL